eukprot:SAG31_NODE_1689_length_7525_cov_3.264745_6_plen_73_part_00
MLDFCFFMAKHKGLAVIFMGDSIFKMLGFEPSPPWYEWVKENKLQACMFLWIINSFAAGQLATQVCMPSFIH